MGNLKGAFLALLNSSECLWLLGPRFAGHQQNECDLFAGSSVGCFGRGACRRPRECPLCRRTFSNHFNMKQHVMNVHAPPVPAQCPKCDCVVRNRLYLRKHLVKAHNVPLRRVFDSHGRRVYVRSPPSSP